MPSDFASLQSLPDVKIGEDIAQTAVSTVCPSGTRPVSTEDGGSFAVDEPIPYRLVESLIPYRLVQL